MNTSPAWIGQARTSTTGQNLDAPIAALEASGCAMIRTEQKSGTRLADRRELVTIPDCIHEGQTLVVPRIDRLARSSHDLQIIVDKLSSKGAHLAANEQPADTFTAAGKAFIDMRGVFANTRPIGAERPLFSGLMESRFEYLACDTILTPSVL